MKKRLLPLMIVATMIFGMGACVKKSDTPIPSPKTYVNIMNMAVYAPPTELYLNTKKATQPLASGQYSIVYSPIEAIEYQVQFKKAGYDSVMASLPSEKYDSLHYYTILLYNDSPATAKAVRIEDDFSNISLSKTNWRFFHMSPNVGAVDVLIDDTKIALSRQYADNIGFGGLNLFQPHNSGFYTIRIKLAGTETVVADFANIALAQGASYTFILKGLEGVIGQNSLELDVLQAVQ